MDKKGISFIAERELPENEALFFNIFKNASISMALLTRDGSYTEVNRSFCRMLGYSRNELLGMNFRNLTHPDDIEEDLSALASPDQSHNKADVRELRYIDKNDRIIWVRLSLSVVRDNRGRFRNYLKQVEDITGIKRISQTLSRREQQFKSLFDKNPSAVFSLDMQGYFRNANHTTVLLSGYTLSSLRNMHFTELCVPEDQDRVSGLFTRALRGRSLTFETGVISASGRRFELKVITMPVVAGKRITEVYCIATNITPEKRRSREKALISSIINIFSIHDNLKDCIYHVLTELCNSNPVISAADAWINRFDTEELFFTARFEKDIDAEDRGIPGDHGELIERARYHRKTIVSKNYHSVGNRYRDATKKEFSKSIVAIPFLSNNRVIAVFLFYTSAGFKQQSSLFDSDENIISLLTSEIQRKKSELELKKLFHTTPDLLVIAGTDYKLKKVNDAFERILGYNPEELINYPFMELVHPDDCEKVGSIVENLKRNIPYEYIEVRLLAKDGSFRWFAWTVLSSTEEELLFGTGKDITEKKNLEKIINAEQERFSRMFHEAPVSMCILKGKDHIITEANNRYYRLTGRTDSIIGKKVREVFPEVERQGYFEWLDKVYQEGETFTSNECPLYLDTKGGGNLEEMYISFMFQPYRNNRGEVEGIFYFGVDVTEQVLARRKIEESEEELIKLSLIARKTADAVIITDDQDRIEWVNNAFTGITGFSPEEAIGKTRDDLLYGKNTDPVCRADINERIRNREPFNYEILEYKKSGESFWVEIKGQPVFHDPNKFSYYFIIKSDISERKRAYAELVRKEADIRNFASYLNRVLEEERARIAREIHDELGQQLTGLKMTLSSLLKSAKDSEAAVMAGEVLLSVDDSIRSLRKISNDLRPAILDSLGLVPAIDWLVNKFKNKSGIPCELEIRVRSHSFDRELSTVFFRICQEALTNIAKHARAGKTRVSLVEHQGMIVLEVKDNGIGLDDHRAGDPLSMGIRGMYERAGTIHADLVIGNDEAGGTRLRLSAKSDDINNHSNENSDRR